MHSSYWWQHPSDPPLAQGDYLIGCLVPVLHPEFGTHQTEEVCVEKADLIVVTQTCDLLNDKTDFAALCPISRITAFERVNPAFGKRGRWEEVRKGRIEGLQLLASPEDPTSNRDALVVDFRQIISLPVKYLRTHADQVPERWRLQSPFLEHFSQAFARFFMRVGLPSAIPPYK